MIMALHTLLEIYKKIKYAFINSENTIIHDRLLPITQKRIHTKREEDPGMKEK